MIFFSGRRRECGDSVRSSVNPRTVVRSTVVRLALADATVTCPVGGGGIFPMKELALRQKWLVPRMVAPADTVGVPAPGGAEPLEPLTGRAGPGPRTPSH